MNDLIQVVGANDFDAATQSGVVLVDFFATWCRPCRMQLPILEQIAPDFEGRAKIIKVDTDQAQDVAVRFGVQSIPTLVLLKNGTKVTQFVGLQQPETLKTALEQALGG
jgi:thioredoxin 1